MQVTEQYAGVRVSAVYQVMDVTRALPLRDQTPKPNGYAVGQNVPEPLGEVQSAGSVDGSVASVRGVVPGVPDADVDVERDVELGGVAHLVADELLDVVALAVGDLEDELVVDLEQDA